MLVTVLGLSPDDVRVVDARRSGSDVDVVRVELGDVHLAGALRTIALVLARAAEGLTAIEAARRHGDPDDRLCAGYGPEPGSSRNRDDRDDQPGMTP